MSDILKGIIIGIIAVKVVESEPVQNYINKTIRKKGKDICKAVADAVFPVRNDDTETPVVDNPDQKRKFTFVKDGNGNVWNVPVDELYECRRVSR